MCPMVDPSLINRVRLCGWDAVDLWSHSPPRRHLRGPFTTILITPDQPPLVEQQGRANWPPCVVTLFAAWCADVDVDAEIVLLD